MHIHSACAVGAMKRIVQNNLNTYFYYDENAIGAGDAFDVHLH